MLEIKTNLAINKDPMHVNIKVDIGGRTVVNRRGHSLVYPFLTQLGTMFHNGNKFNEHIDGWSYDPSFGIRGLYWRDADAPSDSSQKSPKNFGYSIGSVNGDTIILTGENSNITGEELIEASYWFIRSSRAQGPNPNYGIHKVQTASYDSVADTITIQFEDPIPDDTQTDFEIHPVALLSGIQGFASYFRIFDIRIGSGTKTVGIEDMLLEQEFFSEFTDPDLTIDEPVIALSQSKIAITKAFTNQSGVDQTIREIMLYAEYEEGISTGEDGPTMDRDGNLISKERDEGYVVPLARDRISDRVVADGETVTITYEFVVSEDGKKGILATFNELMYRQMAHTDRTVRNWFNNDYTTDESSEQFSLWPTGIGFYPRSLGGIQVGTHTGGIDIDDVDMNDGSGNRTHIVHGEADGQLFHYGTEVQSHGVLSASEAYLDLVGLFENRGSVAVNVNEVGLNVLNTDHPDGVNPVCISRHILDVGDQKVVQPGEVLKVTYRLSITTS